MEVSVIIPTFRRNEYLKQTIADLLAQRGDFSLEIVVADQNWHPVDAREPGYRESLEGRVLWLNCPGRGVVYGRNIAIQASRGDLLVFVDDDVRIEDRGFIEKHIKSHDDKGVAAVCGRETNPGGACFIDTLGYERSTPLDDVFFFPRNYRHRTGTTVLSTCNCSIKRVPLMEAGGFDESFSGASYGDDSDLALRLSAMGFRIVYDPGPWLLHLMAPLGGLRLGTSNSLNDFSDGERVISSLVFYHKHVVGHALGTRLRFIMRHVLRKSILLRRNVKRPWRLPVVAFALLRSWAAARAAVRQGHKFTPYKA